MAVVSNSYEFVLTVGTIIGFNLIHNFNII